MKRELNSGISGALHDNIPSAKIVRVHHETIQHWTFVIDREALWHDLDMDFDEGEVDGAIENSNSGVEDTAQELQSASDSIYDILQDRLLNHLLEH